MASCRLTSRRAASEAAPSGEYPARSSSSLRQRTIRSSSDSVITFVFAAVMMLSVSPYCTCRFTVAQLAPFLGGYGITQSNSYETFTERVEARVTGSGPELTARDQATTPASPRRALASAKNSPLGLTL